MSAGASPPWLPGNGLAQPLDDTLVALAREPADPLDEETVMVRYQDRVERLAARWARWAGLPVSEIPDAKQAALLALVKALRRFDPAKAQNTPCFSSLLWRFVSAGLTNFVRTVRRRENRLDRTVSMEHLQATLEGGRCDKATWPETSSEENNPVQAADTRDLLCLVASILSGFDVRSQVLWQRLVSGQKEKQIAAEFGVTCRTVKRWRAELVRELAWELWKR